MSDAETKYAAGEILLLTSGSYSDYHVQGLAQIKMGCDLAALYRQFLSEWEAFDARANKEIKWPERGKLFDSAGLSSFIVWLEREGYAEEMTCRELNSDDMRAS